MIFVTGKIISFSLYGNASRYIDGALANSKLVKKFFHGWTMRIYHDHSVPETILRALKNASAELMDMSNDPITNMMVWRFLPAGEEEVERFTSRDIDSRLSAREAAAVQEGEASGLPFSVMRDHPSHADYEVSGGLWGS